MFQNKMAFVLIHLSMNLSARLIHQLANIDGGRQFEYDKGHLTQSSLIAFRKQTR